MLYRRLAVLSDTSLSSATDGYKQLQFCSQKNYKLTRPPLHTLFTLIIKSVPQIFLNFMHVWWHVHSFYFAPEKTKENTKKIAIGLGDVAGDAIIFVYFRRAYINARTSIKATHGSSQPFCRVCTLRKVVFRNECPVTWHRDAVVGASATKSEIFTSYFHVCTLSHPQLDKWVFGASDGYATPTRRRVKKYITSNTLHLYQLRVS